MCHSPLHSRSVWTEVSVVWSCVNKSPHLMLMKKPHSSARVLAVLRNAWNSSDSSLEKYPTIDPLVTWGGGEDNGTSLAAYIPYIQAYIPWLPLPLRRLRTAGEAFHGAKFMAIVNCILSHYTTRQCIHTLCCWFNITHQTFGCAPGLDASQPSHLWTHGNIALYSIV